MTIASPAAAYSAFSSDRPRCDSILASDAWGDWQDAVSSRIERLLHLGHDWDTYGASPISEHAIRSAFSLLSYFGPGYEIPDIYPSPNGGLLLQWYYGTSEVDIEVDPLRRNVNLLIESNTAPPVELEDVPISRLLLEHLGKIKQAIRQQP